MNSFEPTERRLAFTCRRYPAFPRQPAVLVRLVKHIFKRVHDDANAELRPWGINHPEYNLLMMLYGTEGHMLNPSQLAEAAGEKSANITRLADGLCAKGLLARANTPPAIIDKLYRQTLEVLKLPQTRERFEAAGTEIVGSSPKEFGELIRHELAQNGKVIKAVGMKAD